jgi:uncharacterized protein (TIGR02145 family)
MKNRLLIQSRFCRILFFVLFPVLLVTCEKPERVVKLTTLDAVTEDISYTSATLQGEILDLGTVNIEGYGIVISKNSMFLNPEPKGFTTPPDKGVFEVSFSNLDKNNLYYFKAYVTVDGKPVYAEVIKQFTTMESGLPVVTTGSITNITRTSASASGEVTGDNGEAVTKRGLCWGISNNPVLTSCVDTTVNGSETGIFIGSMTLLSPLTQYYVRAYAINSKGTAYGSSVAFTTYDLPVVITTEPNIITNTGATSGGNVTGEGGSPVTFRGICWSDSPLPTDALTTKTIQSGGTGSFVSTITGLAPGQLCYVRAYANNLFGTSYGAQFQFRTTKPPSCITEQATDLTISSAKLNGMVNPNYFLTTAWFEYGTSTSYGTAAAANPEIVSGETDSPVSATISELSQGYVYHYRLAGQNSGGTTYGEDQIFTTLKLPSATASAASNIKALSASLNGIVNANNSSTEVRFQFGETESYELGVYGGTPFTVTGNTAASITGSPAGLNEGTTYHYRIWAESEAGITYSNDISFTTMLFPLAFVGEATSVSTTFALLNGTVNANNSSTTVIFEYGTSTSYGQTATAAQSPVTGSSVTAVNAGLTTLSQGTTYHFRIRAESSAGTIYSSDKTFITAAPPSASTAAPTSYSTTGITLNGKANANGTSTAVTFEYGETTSYGLSSNASPSPITGYDLTDVTAALTGLTANTTYHYRVNAVNSWGTTTGTDMAFTTDPVTVSDIEGNVYNVIRIGNQLWMKENLKTTKFNDNTDIQFIEDSPTWASMTSHAYCWPGNDPTKKDVYGGLYNYYTVSTGKICPSGWKVPSDNDFITLRDYLGGNNVAGGKLKEAGLVHWQSPNLGATNESGFTALPAGYRNYENALFVNFGQYAHWYASNSLDFMVNHYTTTAEIMNSGHYVLGFSIRCTKE